MLDSELNDRESNDNPAGRGAPELTRGVPAAVFQPPPVVFQPPAVRPEPAWQESTRPESSTNRRLQLEVIERKDW